MPSPFTRVPPTVDFPSLERGILDLWDELDAFATSVSMRPADSEFSFYDGPPFPTGSPHYGNLLAGVLKDIVPRYWTMRGHRVERRFGWDTHGLPIEMEVQKELGLEGPADIEAYGVAAFNEACRARVMANTEVWEAITRRIGRWVDFEDDYKTMDPDFMESVWWVFKQLWDKGLVYQDFKVLPYSFGAATPLSNFEVNLGAYRDVEDPSITVRLEVTEGAGPLEAGDHLLVWTTTPWTMPSNLGVAVGEDIRYVRIDGELGGLDGRYWLAEARVAAYFGDEPPVPSAEARGSELLGARYRPAFDYFADRAAAGAFVVIASEETTTDEGTGLVHMAPAYGEADFLAFGEAGLDVIVDPVDAEGRFTDEVPDVAGVNVKEADPALTRLLQERGALVQSGTITHAYPFCWRTDTPLIYKAVPTWYVAVERFRDRMAALNEQVHWVPEYVGSRRFGNWLEGARDWAISRNRYWGSCIPVWLCDGCDERVCIGSIDELEERSGVRLDDLHKHYVDEVTFACESCGGTMARVPEVLDVWFESGAMPYAQNHYPFEHRETFERKFPADYIAEGLDQTRGWFYTLVVHAAAIFDTIPFKNCVVNGMILAEDGRKMSKSLKNYPDPFEVIEATGADALRAYLIDSPVVRAEPLRFSEAGVREVVRTVMLPYWNAYSFFTTYAEADGLTVDDLGAAPAAVDRPEIDRWILSVLQSLVKRVNDEMEGYYLYNVIPPLIEFVDDLTNWYIRRSRRRFWGRDEESGPDTLAAFATLYDVLVTFASLMAPVLPFVTEAMYQDLVVDKRAGDGPASVHHEDYPEADEALIDHRLESDMDVVREVVSLGRSLRVQSQIKIRQPLPGLTVVSHDAEIRRAVEAHADLVAEELNVKRVATSEDEQAHAHLSAKANFRILGPRLGPRVKEVATAIEALGEDAVARLIDGGTVEVAGETIGLDDVVVAREPRAGVEVESADRMSAVLDTTLTPELEREGLAREVVKSLQQLRRDAGLDVSDRVAVVWSDPSPALRDALETHGEEIAAEVLATTFGEGDADDELDVEGETLRVELRR
ncbi:MAG: isoleucine--tRNA ligase, partial [Acidimicrobiia bacterium]|nr:isoleucine--tRNA ligase [Acidimicrobiia bacterium]